MNYRLVVLNHFYQRLYSSVLQIVLAQVNVANIPIHCTDRGDFLGCVLAQGESLKYNSPVDTLLVAVILKALCRTLTVSCLELKRQLFKTIRCALICVNLLVQPHIFISCIEYAHHFHQAESGHFFKNCMINLHQS